MDLYSGAGHIIKEMEPEITQKVTMVDSSGKHSLYITAVSLTVLQKRRSIEMRISSMIVSLIFSLTHAAA